MSYRKKHLRPKIKGLKKRKSILKMPLFWIILLCVALIIIAVYLLLFLPQIQISKMYISGNQKIQTQDIENIVLKDINKNIFAFGNFHVATASIFIANTDTIVGDILNAFPFAQSVKVQKDLPAGLTIKIIERKPYAVFCQTPDAPTNTCFSLDENGVLLEPISDVSKIMVVTNGQTNSNLAMGKNIIAKSTMDSIKKVQQYLKNNFQIDITKVLAENPLVFTTSENWQVYVDPESDINLQITKMNSLLQSEITPTARKKLQYIYLQYKDRAYYK